MSVHITKNIKWKIGIFGALQHGEHK